MVEPARDAGESEADAATADGSDAGLFALRLMGDRYAFAAHLVQEVVRLGPLTRLPAAPGFLRGVFAHRGRVVPVLDLAELVGEAPTPVRRGTRAAIVRSGAWEVALVTEAVEGLLGVRKAQLEPPLSEGGGIGAYLAAVGRDARGPVAVIDLPRLLEAAQIRSASR